MSDVIFKMLKQISRAVSGLLLISVMSCGAETQEMQTGASNNQDGKGKQMPASVHDFTMESITGEKIDLGIYRGKVLLIVNVASKCGFTKQYAGLQKLYEKYADKGFLILGFPANNFLSQEPGTNAQIAEFCQIKFGVSFPMFAKISVAGKDIHPLYSYLTAQESTPESAGKITWNFNKILIDGNGKVRNRFGTRTAPEAEKLITAIEEALAAL